MFQHQAVSHKVKKYSTFLMSCELPTLQQISHSWICTCGNLQCKTSDTPWIQQDAMVKNPNVDPTLWPVDNTFRNWILIEYQKKRIPFYSQVFQGCLACAFPVGQWTPGLLSTKSAKLFGGHRTEVLSIRHLTLKSWPASCGHFSLSRASRTCLFCIAMNGGADTFILATLFWQFVQKL